MKDERAAIVRLKDDYWSVTKKLNKMEAGLVLLGCRYRKNKKLCGHPRHTIKKYPQHHPVVPFCAVPVCPRN